MILDRFHPAFGLPLDEQRAWAKAAAAAPPPFEVECACGTVERTLERRLPQGWTLRAAGPLCPACNASRRRAAVRREQNRHGH